MALFSPVLQWCHENRWTMPPPTPTEEPESDRESWLLARGLRSLTTSIPELGGFRKVSFLLGASIRLCLCKLRKLIKWYRSLSFPILIFCEITPFIVFPFHPTKLSTMCLKRWGHKNEVFHPQLLLKVYLQTEGKGKEQPKLTQIRSKGMSPSCSQSLTDELECLKVMFIGKFRGVE